jgi:hypothetical protein
MPTRDIPPEFTTWLHFGPQRYQEDWADTRARRDPMTKSDDSIINGRIIYSLGRVPTRPSSNGRAPVR